MACGRWNRRGGSRIKSAWRRRVKFGVPIELRRNFLPRPCVQHSIELQATELTAMPSKSLFVMALAAFTALPALADTPATEKANLERFLQYAGAPVENFTMWKMYKWQGLGPETVAVWTGVNDVYMLKVGLPCTRLQDAKAIVVTSKMSHQVNRRFDFVNFGTQQCQILEIRPVDYKAMIKGGEPAKKG